MADNTIAFFGPEASDFFSELEVNNNREFFLANKPRYEESIRRPLEELAALVQEKYGTAKVMRPNRDVRFSADKSPYRTDASMWAGSVGGVYLNISVRGIEAGGGLYDPTRDQLARAREAIAESPVAANELRKVMADLNAAGFEWAGPSLKTTPKGFDRDHPNIELLRLKHFAALKHLPLTTSLEEIENTWARVEPLIEWAGSFVGAALSWP